MLFDCLDGRLAWLLYDGGPLRLTLFLGGFLDRFTRFNLLRLRTIRFLFRRLGLRECRFGLLATMVFSFHWPSTQDKDGVTWLVLLL